MDEPKTTVVEQRNGCEIQVVQQTITSAKNTPMRTATFRVVKIAKPRRTVKDFLGSLEEAREAADAEPKVGG